MGLRKVLGLEGSSEYVRTQLERVNRDILRYECIFIAIVSSFIFASTFFSIVPWVFLSPDAITTYRVGLVLICVGSIVCSIVCAKLAKAADESSTIVPTRVALIAYTSFLLIATIVLTACDFSATRSFFPYVVALVLIFGLLYIQPALTIAINIMYAVVLSVILAVTGQGDATAYVTLGAYTFFVIVVSVSNYQTRTREMVASDMVRQVSRHDALTGTKNRRALGEDLQTALGHQVYLLLGDIDDFKFYNDSFGHATGDELLCSFADSMCQAFGAENVYRYGGDEFVAVVLDVEKSEFQEMVDSWRRLFAGVEVEGERYVPTTSGGYVYGEAQSIEELRDMLRFADIQLYDAKESGRNKVLGAKYDEGAVAAALASENLHERRSGSSDSLTGMPSMTYFSIHARSLLQSPALADAKFSFIYFDIEDMGGYIERFGMAAGDDLIVAVARDIEAAFGHALITRAGGDRFLVATYDEDPVEGILRVDEAVRARNGESGTAIYAGLYRYERGVELSAACDFAKLASDHIKGDPNVFYCEYDESMQNQEDGSSSDS